MAQKLKIGAAPEDIILGFPVLKPGTYVCRITNVELTKSKKGDDMAVLSFTPEGEVPITTVEDGVTKEGKVSGRELLTHYVSFSEKAIRAGSIKALQVACRMPSVGYHKDEENDWCVFPGEFSQFQGQLVKVAVENELYEGRNGAKVKGLYPA